MWRPGVAYSWLGNIEWPHVVAADAKGKWHREDGYKWVDASNQEDFRVEREAIGTHHPTLPHVLLVEFTSDGRAAWEPEDGWQWAIPGTLGRVVLVPSGTPSRRYKNVVADGQGLWRPAEGYRWIDDETHVREGSWFKTIRESDVKRAVAPHDSFRAGEATTREVLRTNPDWPLGWMILGTWLREQGKYTDAIDAFLTVESLNPKYIEEVRAIVSKIRAIGSYSERPRMWESVGSGFIAGTGWITAFHSTKVHPDPVALENFRHLHEQAERSGGRMPIDPKSYNFIVGLGRSYDYTWDFLSRVVRDELTKGDFSAHHAQLYGLIRGKSFEHVDCHSNGAMLCLAALELGDARARNVRLFGPQITERALAHWQQLIEQGKVGSVEIVINEGDPIPFLSYAGSYLFDPIELGNLLTSVNYPSMLKAKLKDEAKGIYIVVGQCPGRIYDWRWLGGDLNCHSAEMYRTNIEHQRLKE